MGIQAAAVMIFATFLFVFGQFCMISALPRILSSSDAIVTGRRDGVPLTPRYRAMILIQGVSLYMLSLLLVGGSGAFCFALAARAVESPEVKLLATVLAVLAGASVLILTPFAVVWIAYLRAELRSDTESSAPVSRDPV